MSLAKRALTCYSLWKKGKNGRWIIPDKVGKPVSRFFTVCLSGKLKVGGAACCTIWSRCCCLLLFLRWLFSSLNSVIPVLMYPLTLLKPEEWNPRGEGLDDRHVCMMHPPQGSSEAAANPVVVGIPTAAIKIFYLILRTKLLPNNFFYCRITLLTNFEIVTPRTEIWKPDCKLHFSSKSWHLVVIWGKLNSAAASVLKFPQCPPP